MIKSRSNVSIGYVTSFNFGGWSIPHKIQTAVVHMLAKNNNKQISYCIHEYLDSKNNSLLASGLKGDIKIRNIFFVSALQLNKNNDKFFKIINNFNLYFFLENKFIKKKQNLKFLKEYIKQVSVKKKKNFKRNSYNQLFSSYKNYFDLK